MAYSNTPGKWLGYWSGTVSNAAVTILTVPTGYTFYLDYLFLGAFVALPSGTPAAIYVAADGVPLMMITADNQVENISLPKPIIIPSSMTVGPFGSLGTNIISTVVAWSGEVR